MKRRFAVLVDWCPQLAGGRMALFGTWQTYDAAKEQADRWERRTVAELKAAGKCDESISQFTVEVIELEPKTGHFGRWLAAFMAGDV